jgi:cellulose synthase/poly-beta-1,6-N-acetylglucosamine synthase-like glycosyltransferase
MKDAQWVLWVSAALLVYVYLGYPLLIRLWPTSRRNSRARANNGPSEPSITVIVVAYNEAKIIRARLENILRSNYPHDRLRVLLASDGSTDTTIQRARKLGSPRVKLVEFRRRRGKAAVLNDVVPMAEGDIVVLADARQHFSPDALRVLAAAFTDPKVGAVSGELIFTNGAERSELEEGVGFYWRYEKFIRRHESRIASTVGATGAIYAIRCRLFKPLPESVILDDVLIPMRIVRQGYRVLFEPCARAYDRAAASASREFQRKLRTIAGNFQLFYLEPWLLNPFQNRLWLQTISHKGARLLSPLCLAAAIGANIFLLAQPAYRYLFLAQIVFYVAATAGYTARRARRRHAMLNIPYTFCLLNVATVVAFVSLLSGHQRATWKKTSG